MCIRDRLGSISLLRLIGSICLPKRPGFASRDTGKGWVLNFGGEEEDRTPDLRIANAALSQPVSYTHLDVYKRQGCN